MYSRQTCLHFWQRKNCVGGSSAERVCWSHQCAFVCSHLGQAFSVRGRMLSSFSITSISFVCTFSSLSFRSLIFFCLLIPQLLHLMYMLFAFFSGIIIEPHFGQNSTAPFCFFSEILLAVFFRTFLFAFLFIISTNPLYHLATFKNPFIKIIFSLGYSHQRQQNFAKLVERKTFYILCGIIILPEWEKSGVCV